MASVQDYGCECPNCKQGNMFEDFYYKTEEIYKHCPDCGYHFSLFLENNKLVERETKKPYCAYRITTETDGSIGGSIKNKKEFDLFLEDIKDKNYEVEVSRLLNKKIVKYKL